MGVFSHFLVFDISSAKGRNIIISKKSDNIIITIYSAILLQTWTFFAKRFSFFFCFCFFFWKTGGGMSFSNNNHVGGEGGNSGNGTGGGSGGGGSTGSGIGENDGQPPTPSTVHCINFTLLSGEKKTNLVFSSVHVHQPVFSSSAVFFLFFFNLSLFLSFCLTVCLSV